MHNQRQRSRESTQSRVLDAAGALFEARGFQDATIRDIAERAGVSVGTVMATGDKQSLLVQFFDAHISNLHNARTPIADASANPVTQALGLVEPFIELFLSYPDLARAYASILSSGQHHSTVFAELATRLTKEFEIILQPHCAKPKDTAEALYASYIGTAFVWAASLEQKKQDLEDKLQVVFTAICPTRTEKENE